MPNDNKIHLSGFNNLTKTLGLNIYNASYLCSGRDKSTLIRQINKEYHSGRLTTVLTDVSRIIGANILNVATADYDPFGASTTLLISEEFPALLSVTDHPSSSPLPGSVVAHLDKSHLAAHTYPESNPELGLNILRIDVDISTCGRISPLKALNYLIDSFKSDVVILDYRVRGFARDESGEKFFIDHRIDSIRSYVAADTLKSFFFSDRNLRCERIFHTRLLRREIRAENYIVNTRPSVLKASDLGNIRQQIRRELLEIYSPSINQPVSLRDH